MDFFGLNFPFSSRRRADPPTASASPCAIRQNTPPSAARGCRNARVPTALAPHQIPESRTPRGDVPARRRSEAECSRECRLLYSRSWLQTVPNPTGVPPGTARNPPHNQGCRSPATPPLRGSLPHVPAPYTARSIRIPAEAAPGEARSRSQPFLWARKMDTPPVHSSSERIKLRTNQISNIKGSSILLIPTNAIAM